MIDVHQVREEGRVMSGQDAVDQLMLARAHSLAGRGFASLAVDSAVAALVAGLDGDALRELAGLSRLSRDEDVAELLAPALADVGVVDLSVADAEIIVLRDMATAVLSGEVSVRDMTDWAHAVIGHDTSGPAQEIVELDDELDTGVPNIERTIESFLAVTAHYPGGRAAYHPGAADARPTASALAAVVEHAEALARDGRLREAGRLLRDRLAVLTDDDALRRTLAQIYRAAGHPEQAGRYSLVLPDSIKSERDAYIGLLVATGADENRIRKLSVLPEDAAIPEEFLADFTTARRTRAATQPWDTLTAVGVGGFFITALVTVLAVYFIAVFGSSLATVAARIGGLACLAMLSIGFLALTVSESIRGSRRGPGWGVLTALLATGTVLGGIALFVA